MPAVTESAEPARRHALAAAAVVALVLGTVVVKRVAARVAPRPSAEDCSSLVDRYLEHTLWQREGPRRPEEIASALERARATDEHARDAADCELRLTRAQVDCGIKAPSVDELERCLQ
ncbi:MAG: hypothetical protein FJ095_06785 [Deltaproteobacteria bacterium]|nr:hypothetical protein [Deltaproteobacteria bacterium]